MSLIDKIDTERIPSHIAIIMDGNGRWAKNRGLERFEGHKEGVESVKEIVEVAAKTSVKYLTLYAFSTENWSRPDEEVKALMELMVYAVVQETEDLVKNGIRLQSIGDIERLPEKTRNALHDCMQKTKDGKNLTLIIALSYSSKWEITQATQKIVSDVKNGLLNEESINEKTFEEYLTTRGTPDPDLLIRTGGEQRISNFLLWQTAYSEFYFTDTFWPDFRAEDFYKAIIDYQQRERRFGKTSEQIVLKF